MKKVNLISSVFRFLLVLFFVSCSTDSGLSKREENHITQESYIIAKNKLRGIVAQVREKAWDGNSIDVPSFENIIQNETGWTKEYIYKLENMGLETRSTDGHSDVLSEKQRELLEIAQAYFAQKRFISSMDIEGFEKKMQDFPLKEKQEILQGLLIAKLTQDAIQDEQSMTRGVTLETIACNLATGGIGAVWGEMAFGVALACGASAVATGGVSLAVSLIGSAVLSSVVC